MDISKVKNIIFDLGGVVIDIEFDQTFQAFSSLCNCDIYSVVARFEALNIIQAYDTGQINDGEFRDLIRKELKTTLTDLQIDQAWNALLMDIPTERINLIRNLSNNYRLFVLSNTNNIHILELNNILFKSSGEKDLHNLFEKVYFSYQIGMRKPDLEIYEFVLKEQGLIPEETLFLDDNLDNIQGALQTGMHCVQVNKPVTILEILQNAKKN
ncbi:MAG: HAD family hydrolase [Cytophagaceae bacterium]